MSLFNHQWPLCQSKKNFLRRQVEKCLDLEQEQFLDSKLKSSDLVDLLEGKELDERIVNYWLKWWSNISGGSFGTGKSTKEQFRKGNGCTQRSWIADTVFFKRMIPAGQFSYDHVRRWTQGMELYKLDKLIFPVFENFGSCGHYFVVVLDLMAKAVDIYDSLDRVSDSDAPEILLNWFIQEASEKGNQLIDSDWSFVKQVVPKQKNCQDCAIFALLFASSISVGTPLPFEFDQQRIVDFRNWIAFCVCFRASGCLDYGEWDLGRCLGIGIESTVES